MFELRYCVLDMAPTHATAFAKLKKPGLILADIRLADGCISIDAIKETLEEHQAPVVFITAYPDSFLTSLRPEPTILVSKSIETNVVREVVSPALFLNDNLNPDISPT